MAFIELNEEELAALSEEEKAQYNRQLRLQRERAEFVKKLEQIENADYQYKKPELKRIKPVHRIEIPKYKDIKKASIAMPLGINRKLNERVASQHSVCGKTKERMSNRCVVTNLPAQYKAPPLSVPEYSRKKKREITGVAETRYKIKAPALKFKEIDKKKITDLPRGKTPLLANISFKYSRKPVSIKKAEIKVNAALPGTMKYTGLSDIKINNLPSVSVKPIRKKQYSFRINREKSILDIKAKAHGAKVIPPELLFDYVKKPVKVTKVRTKLPVIKMFNFDNSAEIKGVPFVSVKDIPKKRFVLRLSDKRSVSDVQAKASETRIKAPELLFEKPVIDIKPVPTIKKPEKTDTAVKDRFSGVGFVKIDPGKFDVPVPKKSDLRIKPLRIKDVSVPSLKKYHRPDVPKIAVGKPHKVNLPVLEVCTPDYDEDHVEEIMNRIMTGIQGA